MILRQILDPNSFAANAIISDFVPKIEDIISTDVIPLLTQDPSLQSKLTTRIRSIKLGKMSEEFLSFNNADLNPETNELRFGAGFVSTKPSVFFWVQLLAHEMGHSIDPCSLEIMKLVNIDANQEKDLQLPGSYFEVANYLRSEKSIHAISQRPDTYCPGIVTDEYKNMYLKFDQLLEAFADWVSAQVLPRFISKYYPNLTQQQMREGYSNVMAFGRGSFIDRDQITIHPPLKSRLDLIFLQDPKIREKMGCLK